MARNYAQIATAIWRDDEFRVLSMAAQHAYLLLVSQPDISAAGVLSLNLTRWASRTKDVTKASLRAALEELEAHLFVVVDEETEELLVRSFVRWDGGHTNPKRRPVIRDAAAQIESVTLLRKLATEFERLDLPSEWIPAFPQVDSQSDRQSDSQSSEERVVVTQALVVVPQPPTRTPQPATRIPSRTATRIADDFRVTPDMVTWARENVPHVDGRYETEKFIDYWASKSGKDATKTDWVRTWRNWMRKAGENGPRPQGGPTRSRSDQRVAQALEVGDRLQAAYDRKELEA